MKKDCLHVSLRIEPDLLGKFRYIAKYHDRSINAMMLSIMRKYVAKFETTHGSIPEETE